MKAFILKAEQYNAGEGYEGFWLVYSDTLENAINLLHQNGTIIWLRNLGGLNVSESSLEEASEKFHIGNLDMCFEICGDNYN